MLREAGLIAALVVAACTDRRSDDDGGVLVDEGGHPLADWTIEATYQKTHTNGMHEDVMARIDTAADGRFACFEVESVGRLAACPPGTSGCVRRRVDPETVCLAERGLRLQLVGGTTIGGRVVDTARKTFPRYTVRATVRQLGRAEERTIEASPAFVIRSLDPGDLVDLAVDHPGYEPARMRDLVPGSDVRLEIVPRSTRTDGVVLDTTGRGIALAWVRFRPCRGGCIVQTLCDLDGRFTERETLDAEYDVTVLAPHPTQSYEPGVPAGRVQGGARDVVLRVPR